MTGAEWIVDVTAADPAALRDRPGFERIFRKIVGDLRLHGVGRPKWHRFPRTGGLTGVWILSESHLTVHTFPEFGSLCLNLFSCRARPAPDWRRALAPLGTDIVVRTRRFPRNYAPAEVRC